MTLLTLCRVCLNICTFMYIDINDINISEHTMYICCDSICNYYTRLKSIRFWTNQTHHIFFKQVKEPRLQTFCQLRYLGVWSVSKTRRPNPYPRGNGIWGIVQTARAGLPSSLWTNRSRMNHRSPPVQLPLQPE